MKRYRSHKVVEAAKILTIAKLPNGDYAVDLEEAGKSTLPANMITRYVPVPGDYVVRYEDGYQSVSPKKAFEDGYTSIEDEAAQTDEPLSQQRSQSVAIAAMHAANAPNVRNAALSYAMARTTGDMTEALFEADKVAKWLQTGELPAANVTTLRSAE